MEKAQKVLKARQEFVRYPVTSTAKDVFDWILDELDARTRVMVFEPIQVYLYKDRLMIIDGHEYPKDLTRFLQEYSAKELFTKLKDLIDKEQGFKATLIDEGREDLICIDII